MAIMARPYIRTEYLLPRCNVCLLSFWFIRFRGSLAVIGQFSLTETAGKRDCRGPIIFFCVSSDLASSLRPLPNSGNYLLVPVLEKVRPPTLARVPTSSPLPPHYVSPPFWILDPFPSLASSCPLPPGQLDFCIFPVLRPPRARDTGPAIATLPCP